MVCTGCIRCENFKQDFVARTFALIAPVRPVLYRASCSNKTIPNAPKWYEMQKNNSLGSNGVDRVRSFRKIPMQLRGTNFCTNSARFVPSFGRQPNGPKCTQMVRNAAKRQFREQWGGSGVFFAKNSDATSWHELLHQFGPFCTEFRKATKRSQMHPNLTKCSKTIVQGPMGWIGWVHREKLRCNFVARTFALVRPVLHRVP